MGAYGVWLLFLGLFGGLMVGLYLLMRRLGPPHLDEPREPDDKRVP